MTRLLVWLTLLIGFAGCTINPVTGQRQLALVSAEEEISIGRTQYSPSRQMQGGDYVLDPQLTAYVRRVGQRMAAVSDRALPYEFSVLNSSVPNAWALPGGKIAINRGLLLELDSEAELAAVLGHEVVHAAARHGAQAMQRGLLLQGALLATAAVTQGGNFSSLTVGAASVGAQLINQRNTREAELESDLYGMRYMSLAGYDAQAAVSLQQTFLRLSEGRAEQGWLAGLFASHPPSAERVQQNRNTALSLRSGGEVGRERYQAAIDPLVQSKAAYDAYEDARAALADGRNQDAEDLAREAIRLEPNEGHFHSLLGDVDFAADRYDSAVAHYRDAVTRNDQFFYYRLRKGLAHQYLQQWNDAQTDLEASVALLPTADAYFALGSIAEQRGEPDAALEHYRLAAESSTNAGQAAQDALVRLELPGDPAKYLALRTSLTTGGQLRVELANPTRLTVGQIVLAIRYIDTQGVLQQTRRELRDPLPPSGAREYATGLGPFTSTQSYEVLIERANVIAE